jgi:hypothetical protein
MKDRKKDGRCEMKNRTPINPPPVLADPRELEEAEADARFIENSVIEARCRLTALVELLEHDLHIEPALELSNEGLLGLRRILEDTRDDLDPAKFAARAEMEVRRMGCAAMSAGQSTDRVDGGRRS